MVVLQSGASRYHNYCIDGGTSPEYFGYTLVSHQEEDVKPAESGIRTGWSNAVGSFT
jgi:hypothetical protein